MTNETAREGRVIGARIAGVLLTISFAANVAQFQYSSNLQHDLDREHNFKHEIISSMERRVYKDPEEDFRSDPAFRCFYSMCRDREGEVGSIQSLPESDQRKLCTATAKTSLFIYYGCRIELFR